MWRRRLEPAPLGAAPRARHDRGVGSAAGRTSRPGDRHDAQAAPREALHRAPRRPGLVPAGLPPGRAAREARGGHPAGPRHLRQAPRCPRDAGPSKIRDHLREGQLGRDDRPRRRQGRDALRAAGRDPGRDARRGDRAPPGAPRQGRLHDREQRQDPRAGEGRRRARRRLGVQARGARRAPRSHREAEEAHVGPRRHARPEGEIAALRDPASVARGVSRHGADARLADDLRSATTPRPTR